MGRAVQSRRGSGRQTTGRSIWTTILCRSLFLRTKICLPLESGIKAKGKPGHRIGTSRKIEGVGRNENMIFSMTMPSRDGRLPPEKLPGQQLWTGKAARTSQKCEFSFTLVTEIATLTIHRMHHCRLHREVEAFVNYVSPTPVEDEVRSLVVEIVSKAVTQAFPDAEVKPFGSFGTKLYLPRGYVPVYPIDYLLIYDTTL